MDFLNERKPNEPINFNNIPTEFGCIHLECRGMADEIEEDTNTNKSRCNMQLRKLDINAVLNGNSKASIKIGTRHASHGKPSQCI